MKCSIECPLEAVRLAGGRWEVLAIGSNELCWERERERKKNPKSHIGILDVKGKAPSCSVEKKKKKAEKSEDRRGYFFFLQLVDYTLPLPR